MKSKASDGRPPAPPIGAMPGGGAPPNMPGAIGRGGPAIIGAAIIGRPPPACIICCWAIICCCIIA